MKLDRDTNPSGTGKYALINLRKDTVEWGRPGEQDEFFVIKLRDTHAHAALQAYADSVRRAGDDPEYAEAVQALADRSGALSPFCKNPD